MKPEELHKRHYIVKRRLKHYWPYFLECETCDAPEGKPCWNLNDRRSKIRTNPKYWKFNLMAHDGRVKMSKEAYVERQHTLSKATLRAYKETIDELKDLYL